MPARTRKKAPAPAEAPEDVGAESIAELVAQFSQANTRCRLFRFNETARRLEYVTTLAPTVDLIEKTQQSYGGGEYTARLCDDSGKLIKGASIRFTIAGPARYPDELLEAPRAVVHAAPVDSSVERLVTIVTALVGAVTPLVVPLLTRKPAEAQSITDTLALMQAAEDRGERRGEQLGELRARGGREPKESITDVAKAFVPVVSSLIDKVQMRRQEQPGQPPRAPQLEAPPALPAPAVPTGYEWLATLRPYYPMLLQQAARGNDPAMLADFTLDQCDDELFTKVETAAQAPGFLETLTRDMPGLATSHPEWLAAYLARIVENCQPETEPAIDLTTRERKKA